LHGVPDPGAEVARVLGRVDLLDRASDRAGQLSKGLKQRAALARALINDPRIVLLDEPTAGLDPASARRVRDLILTLKADGKAVVVSTHNLSEAETLCDRIAVLNTRVLALGAPDVLRTRPGGVQVSLTVEGDASAWALTVQRGPVLAVDARGAELVVTVRDVQHVPDLVQFLVQAGVRIRGVATERRTLEEVYLELIETP
jgi:ABC-2 type transport system ATP-binding protein